jgi:type II secretory pathway component PulF
MALALTHTDDAEFLDGLPEQSPGGAARRSGGRRPRGRSTAASRQAVAEATSQLAIMVRSGLDLATALQGLSRQCERPDLAEALEEVHSAVTAGSPLSQALARYPKFFDGAYVATVAAAEASGRMAEVLVQLAAMQRGQIRLHRTMRGLLTYPVILVGVSLTVTAALVIFVLPSFADIFEQYDTQLPVSTQALLALSGEIRARWWLWFPSAAGVVLAATTAARTEAGRRRIDAALVLWSPFCEVTRPLYTGRLCRLLGMLLNSGVPILQSLRLVKDSMTNCYYSELCDEMSDSVLNGRGLAPALEDELLLPEAARNMLETAERSGRLAEVADILGDYYDEEAETRMRNAVRMLEPAITVVMGVIIAVVVLSVMLPIFELSTVAGEGA